MSMSSFHCYLVLFPFLLCLQLNLTVDKVVSLLTFIKVKELLLLVGLHFFPSVPCVGNAKYKNRVRLLGLCLCPNSASNANH